MKNRIVLWGLASLVLACVVAAAGLFYFRTFSPDREKYPVRGIDVSHHQGRIDWRRVAADDVAFAVIKATEGGDHVDDAFSTNLREARGGGGPGGGAEFLSKRPPGRRPAEKIIKGGGHPPPQ
ncbi:lysozyme, partial [Mesorhizobium sp. M0152]|uniref:GH25 family lysozyme n=1 Tax=Mesorhizobium sp. M0152 TaxID=2956898 RepID=UPI0033351AE3